MFNLLYKKYKNDILKFSAWEELIGGCGQILGPCYFKLVPDFACTP